ncbi:SpoIIE family protein phosphatase [Pollutimonas sp. M17]|uniref:SpoIIE family protein phosphatase n=1 Tax=Pollutimonas sp. M17 TaxID=2962065 RepID=UPI0021F4A000|nr:SpoIIE family protein phosphatase [Pollutimonas sp. M17]UYO93403.1 SpoIIE family protein phosphatase [Pollutimonas sp. M17]
MRLTSLRSKIFLLVGLTLLISAIAVMLVTERDVKRTVVTSEELAVRNVLNLLVRDSEARWGSLLNDKISTVRSSRQQLMQLGNTVRSVLAMYAAQVERKELSLSEAQGLAREWVNDLSIGEERFSFIFNHDLIAIASGNSEWLGMNLSTLKDFKGRDLAASAYQEAQTSGQSFAIYRWPPPGTAGKRELRYAYFAYFEPWDWIFAVTDDARQVSDQFDRRRQEMEHAIGESLASLTLAQSGFAFIAADDGTLVSPLPSGHAGLLGDVDEESGKTLRELLDGIPSTGDVSSFGFTPRDTDDSWQISSAYFKPLGWTIVAAVPSEDLTRAATELRNRLGMVFLAILLVSLAIAWAFSVRLTRPLQQLSDFARVLPEQDLSAASPIPPHIARLPQNQPDEVGRLAATFMFMDKELREKVAKLVQETSSRERFESELNIAHGIQMGLLPIPLPASILKKIDLYATMIPAKEVGGDLYDYFMLPDGRLCFAIGDVSDKGVPAALFMAVTRTLIRASAEDETSPALLMERVNNRLSENNPNLMFVTLILAVLDLASGELQWANAGHPSPCVLSAGGDWRLLEGRSGPACGVMEGVPYKQFSTILEPGETIVGFTDGVTEALDPDGHLYGEPRLYALLTGTGSDTAQSTTSTLLDDVRAFAQGTEQSDDITLIAAKRPAP